MHVKHMFCCKYMFSVIYVRREVVSQALNEMKTGKAVGASYVSLELIAASGRIGI